MENWPSFGYFSYKGTYFRMHHGNSNKQYADIPSSSVFHLIVELANIDDESSNRQEFWNRAKSKIDEWNDGVKEAFKIPENMIMAALDKYYWGDTEENGVYGLKIRINQKLFFDFLKERSESLKSVYKVFEYIYDCKYIFTERLLEDDDFPNKMDTYIEKVKETTLEDFNEISRLLQNLIKSADNARYEIVGQINRSSKKGRKPAYTPYTLIYINELRLKSNSLKSLTDIGDFSASLSQMRGIIEGLTSNIFLDQLHLNFISKYKTGKVRDLRDLFNEDSYKEARNYSIMGVKEIDSKTQLVKNEVLKGIADHVHLSSDEIKKFIVNLHKRMSFASYLMVYGLTFSNSLLKDIDKNKLDKSKLWIFNTEEESNDILVNTGLQEINDALKDSGIHDKKKVDDYMEEIRKKIRGEKLVLVPPTPTLPLRIISHSVLTKKTASGLKEMYDEFSPFTHSTWETNTVWPFTSVLEVMTFKHNLRRFVEVVGDAIEDYIMYFSKMEYFFLL